MLMLLLVLQPLSCAERIHPEECSPLGVDVVLQYDDGTAAWLTWGGLFRGVWFDTQDFAPGSTGFLLEAGEFWFYHHSSYPWDTSSFYAELTDWPVTTSIEQVSVTALHMTPVMVWFDPPIPVPQLFALVANSGMSSGGWPSMVADGEGCGHSFFSDDYVVWETSDLGDYFTRAHGEFTMSLEGSTWGAIKNLWP